MASTTTEELVITIKVDDKDASSKLDMLKSKIQDIESISRGKGFQHLSEVASTLTKLAHATDNMGASAKNLRDLGEAANVFSQRVKNIKTGELRDAASAIDSFKGAIGRLNDAGANGGAINIKTANTSAIAKTSDAAKMLANEFKTAVKWGSKIAQIPFRMLFEPIKGVAARVQSLTGAFTGLFAKIGRVALMRAIRGAIKIAVQAIKEGVGAVYEWASAVGNSFTGTMDTISTSLTYFRNSIGAAISPILDAVAPVLDAVIDKCVAVVNVFNQLIATLTGASTWRRAEKVATSYGGAVNDATKGTKAANSAAKELKRTLLGFDEINRLEAPDKDSGTSSPAGGSGSGDVTSGALAFTEQPISSAVADFAQKLKDAWAKADFTEIGTMIGTRVGTALMSIPWTEKIQPVVVNLAKSFGTLLNGMFDYTGSGGKAMWDGIAYTVYNALNTAMLGYVTFFNTVNWNGIGQGIGAALKRVLTNGIDWNLVSEALSAFPNAVIDTVTGFNSKFTYKDFKTVGTAVGNAVATAIVNIKWADFFQNSVLFARGILNALNGALEGFGQNWSAIKDGIIGGIKSVKKETWLGLGEDIGKLVFNVANFTWNIVSTLIDALANADWDAIWEGFKKGLGKANWTGLADNITKFIGSHLGEIAIVISLLFAKFKLAQAAKTIMGLITGASIPSSTATLGSFLSNISLAAGVILAIDTLSTISNLKWDTARDKLIGTLKAGLKGALSGALIGFGIGGVAGGAVGGLIGLALGIALTLWIKEVMPKIDQDALNKGLKEYRRIEENAAAQYQQAMDLNISDEEFARIGTLNYENSNSNSKKNLGFQTNDKLQLPRQLSQTTKQSITVEVVGNLKKLDNQLTDKQKTVDGMTAQYDKRTGSAVQPITIPNYIAQYDKKIGVGITPFTLPGNTVRYDSKTGAAIVPFVLGGNTAKYDSKTGKGIIGEWISGFGAWYTKKTGKALDPEWVNGFGAIFTSNTVNWPKAFWTISGFVAGIVGWFASPFGKANGGVFKNGRWHDITNYAAGGTPGSGQMFIAREAGPELVGTIGGSTAVMNNDQIVQSVANGVASAVAAVMGGQGNSPIEVTVKVDSETLYRTVKKGERKASGRYGTAVAIG